MQELNENLRQVIEKEELLDTPKHLRETAKKWANYVLESNCDEALKKGLEISRAICEYVNEMEDENFN